MGATVELIQNNTEYAAAFDEGNKPMPPSRKVAVVACMDARIDVYRALGLELGEAHVIRNAGGVVTDDVVRSLVISQELLGTEEIILVHHSDCGMLTFKDDDLKLSIHKRTGIRPSFSLEAFPEPTDDVRQSIARLKANPFLVHKDGIRGFVYDVDTGVLQEVS